MHFIVIKTHYFSHHSSDFQSRAPLTLDFSHFLAIITLVFSQILVILCLDFSQNHEKIVHEYINRLEK